MSTTYSRLYETDFYGWIQNQAGVLRSGDFASLDLNHLIEEIEDMGKGLQRELTSRFEILLAHLLKWQYQATFKGTSWELTIDEQRDKIAELIEDNPSLKPKLESTIARAYKHAKRIAMKETGIHQSKFPPHCPWSFDQVMDADFWPESV